MPQMMPINWLLSFFLFLLIYLTFNIMNYYTYNINLNNKNFKNKMINTKKNNFYWKW
uniref:ATP synthase F0 subunit 8 n=1 Tax=Gynaephora rossii TaxID=1496476 RepID=UPI0020366F9B|nr:ATP synthase F0 subunit 8 [Gynaephora rossii]YP_010403099.1 ATP synthase F0 subunit 8 [Gynaephora groenlandica]UQW19907.1 ATP synthase F0 subunit 8 [Gynaephora rossii]UQW19920.1 ATP synthase F0 subunit 8 [Gynaephora groenlandica]